MKSLQLSLSELQSSLRASKAQRSDTIKKVKQLYQQLEQRGSGDYDSALERAHKNLKYFMENKFESAAFDFNAQDELVEYRKKMAQFQTQIKKMQNIINSGCGTVVKKPLQNSGISKTVHENETNIEQKNE